MVLAHQGGWDEILLVVGSLAVIGALLAFAHRRANALARARAAAAETPEEPADVEPPA